MEYTNEEVQEIHKMACDIVTKLHKKDASGRLLLLLVCKISAIIRLPAYRVCNEHKFRIIKDDNDNKKCF